MTEWKGIRFLGTGSSVGSRSVDNDEIAPAAGTTDEWIQERTGIRHRFYCAEEENNVTLAIKAAEQALERSGIARDRIGLCIAATMTPEFATPSTACLVQAGLGLPETAVSFDLNAACSGFLMALDAARAHMYLHDIDYALVVGSEKFSDILDMTDYGTAIIFGDGAGAAVIGRSDRMFLSIGGTRGSNVIWAQGPGKTPSILHMQGRKVFKFATGIIEQSTRDLLEKSGKQIGDVDHFVFHQANERIIDFVARRMKLDSEKVHKNISRTGNTSAASVPLLLDELVTADVIHDGDLVLSVGFGGGLTWAGLLMEWTGTDEQ